MYEEPEITHFIRDRVLFASYIHVRGLKHECLKNIVGNDVPLHNLEVIA